MTKHANCLHIEMVSEFAHRLSTVQRINLIKYKLIVGSDDSKSKYSAVGLPTTYLIDREGRIRQRIVGARTRGEFEAMLRPLLDEAQTASK